MVRPGAIPCAATAGFLLLGILTAPLSAQVVLGTVVRRADGLPAASVTMLVSRVGGGVNHRAATDSVGRFRLRPFPRGEYQLSVELGGRRTDVGPPLALTREDTLTVHVGIPRASQARPEFSVVSTNRSSRLESVGYYRRGIAGAGTYIGPGTVGERNWTTTSEMISHPRVRGYARLRTPFTSFAFRAFADFRPGDAFGVYGGGSYGGVRCLPTLFVDGVPYGPAYRDVVDRVAPRDIEGVEIYPSYGYTPREFTTQGSPCGAVLIWLRALSGRGIRRPTPTAPRRSRRA